MDKIMSGIWDMEYWEKVTKILLMWWTKLASRYQIFTQLYFTIQMVVVFSLFFDCIFFSTIIL